MLMKVNIKIGSVAKFDDWFPTVRSQTIFLTAYLRSNRHKPFKKIDRETGEILE